MTPGDAKWKLRLCKCLANGTTATFSSATHVKSYLAGHGYDPLRNTECD